MASLSFIARFKQLATGEVFFAELDHINATFDGLGYLFNQGRVVAEAAVRYQAEGRA